MTKVIFIYYIFNFWYRPIVHLVVAYMIPILILLTVSASFYMLLEDT